MQSIETDAGLQEYAENIIKEQSIPAVSISIWHNNTLYSAAAGTLNVDTGVTATTDSIFQIGSITKVFTASLIMQLVDEGKVDLDNKVQYYLRDFQIADQEASQSLTVRQLLNHTNGIAGDFFPEDEEYDGNFIARYMDRCRSLPLIHPIGEMYSYSNSAFGIAGRLVEVVRKTSWYRAMQGYIYHPLKMLHAIADPKEAIRYRVAMGHVDKGENTEQWKLANRTYLPLGLAPAGSTPTMSARDLITFSRAHLNNGLAPSGERWLTACAVNSMQNPQIELPRQSRLSRKYAGIGWNVTDYIKDNIRVISHSGTTRGSIAMLQLIPAQNRAFVIMMNSCNLSAMSTISADLLRAISGIDSQDSEPCLVSVEIDQLKLLTGHYRSLNTSIEIILSDDNLIARITNKAEPFLTQQYLLKPVTLNCFSAYTGTGISSHDLVFLKEDNQGVPQYLFYCGRLINRVP